MSVKHSRKLHTMPQLIHRWINYASRPMVLFLFVVFHVPSSRIKTILTQFTHLPCKIRFPAQREPLLQKFSVLLSRSSCVTPLGVLRSMSECKSVKISTQSLTEFWSHGMILTLRLLQALQSDSNSSCLCHSSRHTVSVNKDFSSIPINVF